MTSFDQYISCHAPICFIICLVWRTRNTVPCDIGGPKTNTYHVMLIDTYHVTRQYVSSSAWFGVLVTHCRVTLVESISKYSNAETRKHPESGVEADLVHLRDRVHGLHVLGVRVLCHIPQVRPQPFTVASQVMKVWRFGCLDV
jgi:hypothetical protein